jgi:diacylglycerol kinase
MIKKFNEFIIKRIKSFRYAINGIRLAGKEPNFMIHIIIACFNVLCGFTFNISSTEWLAILITFSMVLSAEIVNTAIEKMVDFVSPDYHEKAGKIKDLAAGAVLITAIFAVIVGIVIFLPKI